MTAFRPRVPREDQQGHIPAHRLGLPQADRRRDGGDGDGVA
ncbi:hypothetical protein [Roseovarius ramblicola]|uniref:Uncharacterized protein n=1 Tax=Roseovarius ramblicola TaxID=2022336 RepID=A0ABV5I3H8_9RHOB